MKDGVRYSGSVNGNRSGNGARCESGASKTARIVRKALSPSALSLGVQKFNSKLETLSNKFHASAMSDENEEDHRDTIHMNAAAPWQRSRCMLS